MRRLLMSFGTTLVLLGFHPALGALPARERVVRPPAAPGPLDNPLKGWCPGPGDVIHQPYSLVFQGPSWRELEPKEGAYQFEEWEKRAWGRPQDRGKHVVFRVHVDQPGSPVGLPEWLRAKGVKLTPYTEYGGGQAPDYNHPAVVAGMERLVAALGKRYDPDPRVAFVQMGLLGFWGEWHTYPHTELFASDETQRRIVAAYRKAFAAKIVQARTARGSMGQQPGFGFHDDLFPEDTDGPEGWKFLPTLRTAGRSENWRRAAIGGEMAFRSEDRWLGPDFGWTEDMIGRAHFSFLGPYNPAAKEKPAPEYRDRLEQLVRRMGYEFALREVRHPEQVARGAPWKFSLEGINQGVAPFYYPWPVELALINDQGLVAERLPVPADVRAWQPGPFRIAASPTVHAPTGKYTLGLGIRDPWSGEPAVGFANRLPRRAGWTEVSQVEVVPAR